MIGLVCFSCGDEAVHLLQWGGKHQAYYCEGCAQSVIEQLEDEGFKVNVDCREGG